MEHTVNQYKEVVAFCQDVFTKKMEDYGSAWRILRLPSLTDQIFIKAQRIRTLQEKKEQKIIEGQEEEFVGIINYSVIALIQLHKGVGNQADLSTAQAVDLYESYIAQALSLM